MAEHSLFHAGYRRLLRFAFRPFGSAMTWIGSFVGTKSSPVKPLGSVRCSVPRNAPGGAPGFLQTIFLSVMPVPIRLLPLFPVIWWCFPFPCDSIELVPLWGFLFSGIPGMPSCASSSACRILLDQAQYLLPRHSPSKHIAWWINGLIHGFGFWKDSHLPAARYEWSSC